MSRATDMTCDAFAGALVRLTAKHHELYWRIATEAEEAGIEIGSLSEEQKQAVLQSRFVGALVKAVELLIEQTRDHVEAIDYLEFLSCSILDALYQVGKQDERLLLQEVA